MPVPYNRLPISQCKPVSSPNKAVTSILVSTTGSRCGRLARSIPSSQGSSTPSTCLYRNNSADKAWFWVATATCP